MQTLAACIVLFIKEDTAYLSGPLKEGLKERKGRRKQACPPFHREGFFGEGRAWGLAWRVLLKLSVLPQYNFLDCLCTFIPVSGTKK